MRAGYQQSELQERHFFCFVFLAVSIVVEAQKQHLCTAFSGQI